MGPERRQGGRLLNPQPLVVDTDLGSDPDDELTVAFVWGSPELRLERIVVSYGDTAVRAGIARRMGELAGRPVAVSRGTGLPRSGAPVWWAGHEGDAYAPLPPATADFAGVQAIAGMTEGLLLAIAPLTTVADAFDADPALPARLRRLTIMGGDFGPHAPPEHNIRSDVAAARAVFAADPPCTVVGLDITRQVRLHAAELDRIRDAGPLGRVLATELDAWLARWGEPFAVPHDPLAALTLVRPELFEFSAPGRIVIDDAGASRHVAGPGRAIIVTAVDAERAAAEITARVVAGSRSRPGAPVRHERYEGVPG